MLRFLCNVPIRRSGAEVSSRSKVNLIGLRQYCTTTAISYPFCSALSLSLEEACLHSFLLVIAITAHFASRSCCAAGTHVMASHRPLKCQHCLAAPS